ncbi:MAG: hypothetical protein ACTSPB_25160, partial [Candidatus Thorarchaeota archaeon]
AAATDFYYKWDRYFSDDPDPVFDSIMSSYDNYPITRNYVLKWKDFEIGNNKENVELPIIGGPDKDATFMVLTKNDIMRVEVYLVKGFYPDTGSLVEAGIDLNDPERNSTDCLYGPIVLTDPSTTLSFGPDAYKWLLSDFVNAQTKVPFTDEATSATYTFVIQAYDFVADSLATVVETEEFPFILDIKGPEILIQGHGQSS